MNTRLLLSLLLLAALLSTLAACTRKKRSAPGEPVVAVHTPAGDASAQRPPPSATSPPTATLTPTPLPPPLPTPEIDLTDYTIYRQNLLEEFAAELDGLRAAPHYFIQARLLPGDRPAISGVQRVRITNQEPVPLNELYFRLYPNLPAYGGSAQVGPVIVNNQFAETTTELEDSALRVALDSDSLPDGLAPGAVADVTLWFTATLPTQVVAGTAGSGLYGVVDGVYDLAGFYPTLAVYDDEGWNLEITTTYGDSPFTDIGFYQVELIVPAGQTVVASGSEIAQSPGPDGTVIWRIAAGPARSFYAAVTDHWQVLQQHVDGVLVNSYYPAGELASGQTALTYTTGSLHQFGQMFGPYPYRELDVIPLPTTGFGMEYAGLFALAASFYSDAGGAFAIATPHEVAHQWFFNLVGNDQPDEPWLDEALANYAVYLYYEAIDWPEMQTAMLENVFRFRYNAAINLGIDRPVAGPVVAFDQSDYINIVYSKGPLFFHAVRERIGDQAFFAALRDYADQHRYGIAYPADLFAAFRRHSDAPIDDLIAFWLTGA